MASPAAESPTGGVIELTPLSQTTLAGYLRFEAIKSTTQQRLTRRGHCRDVGSCDAQSLEALQALGRNFGSDRMASPA